MNDPEELPPLFRLPLEIRILIYKELLVADTVDVRGARNLVSLPDYHIYEPAPDAPPSPEHIVSIRNDHTFTAAGHAGKARSVYKIRADRFRARCIDTTYTCVNAPAIHTAVLRVSRQVHAEAARVLYSSYCFDFDTNVEASIPFLTDLTPVARACVRSVSVVKKALPYDKDFDACEWRSMCRVIADSLQLTHLALGVVAGKPIAGYVAVEPFHEADYRLISRQDDMEWVRNLQAIKGLSRLEIRPCVEHCPPPESNAMLFFVSFSASIADGFAKYMTAQMTPQVTAY